MYSRNKWREEIPCEATAVWVCSNEECKCWMRNNFSFESIPTCWKCQSPMTSGTRQLPPIHNNNPEMKGR
jgi:hypothetical protein